MKKQHKFVALLIAIVFCLCSTTVVQAYQLYILLDLDYQNQVSTKDNWCWATDASVTLDYFGISATQYQFCYATFGTYEDRTTDIWHVQYGFSQYSVSSTKLYDTITYTTIKSNISYSRPIIVHQDVTGEGGHAVLVDGYDTTYGDYVMYMNPHNDGPTTAHYVSYNYFLENANYEWWYTLYNIHD